MCLVTLLISPYGTVCENTLTPTHILVSAFNHGLFFARNFTPNRGHAHQDFCSEQWTSCVCVWVLTIQPWTIPLPLCRSMVGTLFYTYPYGMGYLLVAPWQSWTSMVGVWPWLYGDFPHECPLMKAFTSPPHTHTYTFLSIFIDKLSFLTWYHKNWLTRNNYNRQKLLIIQNHISL